MSPSLNLLSERIRRDHVLELLLAASGARIESFMAESPEEFDRLRRRAERAWARYREAVAEPMPEDSSS